MKKQFSAIVWGALVLTAVLGGGQAGASAPIAFRPPVSNSGPMADLHRMIPLGGSASQSDLLQFTAAGHVLGFGRNKAYFAGLDHGLSVEFLGTAGVVPQAAGLQTNLVNGRKSSPLTKVVYPDLWPGISLVYESTRDGIVESIYHLTPGADVSHIRLRYNVPAEARADGSLRFKFERGYLTELPPIAWQEIEGKRASVAVAFDISGNEVGFKIGKYARDYPLIIDPVMAWNTFYGSNDFNYGAEDPIGIVVDGSGNVYITGTTGVYWNGPLGELPLHANAGGPADAWNDIFILKLDSNGAYQWHTFYGSGGIDGSAGIALDGGGNIYVAGFSDSSWGTPLHAFTEYGTNLFVLKLNSNGLYQWNTFYGASYGAATAQGIALDNSGNVYVSGYGDRTWGVPLHPFSGIYDIFVLKLNSSGLYQWHTFYGSSDNVDFGRGIAVDGVGGVYVTGSSMATWETPINGHVGDEDIFVLKLNSSGGYEWNTFFGSPSYGDYGKGIAVDQSGNVYVTGFSPFEWGGPINPFNSASDVFVLKLNSNGVYQWNTFFGSPSGDDGQAIAVDRWGNVYVAGTYINNGSFDILALKLDTNGVYQWHTLHGAPDNKGDHGYGIAVDGRGNVYVAGTSVATWGTPLNPFHEPTVLVFMADVVVLKLNSTGKMSDFNGNGATDIAAFHLPSDQFFTYEAGNLGAFGWGGPDCYTLLWDQNGDGKTDISVYHIPTNQWFVRGYPAVNENMGQFGWNQDECIPVPGDYDGDGVIERAFYHWPTNRWLVEGQAPVEFGYGGANCIPIVGDFDGDGKDDMVLYNVADNQWFMYGFGAANQLGQFGWAGADCIPVPGDWNGDGKWELGIYFVPANEWLWREHDNPNPADVHFLHQFGWGAGESFPIPGDYNGDGTLERAFYRSAQNWWFIEGQPNFYWGYGGEDFMPITSQMAVFNWFRFKLGLFQ